MTREEIILLLLASPGSVTPNTIVGMTRLQKMLFLSIQEGGLHVSGKTFEFVPYKFGPVSKKVYDDLCLLEELGLIETSSTSQRLMPAPGTDPMSLDAAYLLSAEALPIVDHDDDVEAGDAGAELSRRDIEVYKITDKGLEFLKQKGLLESQDYKTVVRIKKRYAGLSLADLLRYVYTNYKEYATESEIADKIM